MPGCIINGVLEWIPEQGSIDLSVYYGKAEQKEYSHISPYEQQLDFKES